ncbi:NAD(P)-binding protein [Thozetella sp. PMI_491]|nr:NAD(P)-binding protein [Thozetella sp. PMI_491]
MVSLSAVRTSNSLISTALPAGLVAVFVGGTSGIGEASVKAFAKHARKPQVYIVGRSQDAADRILAECKTLNPEGKFAFLKADVSLIRTVDEVCNNIKAKEKTLNLLFLSCGVMDMSRTETSENLHLLAALNYYSRIRFIQNLLPLIQKTPSLRRIVSVGGGGHEGKLDQTDYQARRVPVPELREHLTTLVTLGLEALARTAPEVSIVNDYPGTVKTPLLDNVPPEALEGLEFVPIEESGERHVYLATSARYPSVTSSETAVPLGDGINVAVGSNGKAGSGVYSIGKDCESASPEVIEKLAGLREQGMVDEVWNHTEAEFKRILETSS